MQHAVRNTAARPSHPSPPASSTSLSIGAPDHACLLTLDSLLHRPLFLDVDGARAISRLHCDPRIWGNSRCLAWVLMPDHWQALVVIDRKDSADRLVRRFKARCARAVEPRLTVNGWLWSRGFGQRMLQSGDSLVALARELVSRPVRSGLVASVADYPYWNAVWLDPACTESQVA